MMRRSPIPVAKQTRSRRGGRAVRAFHTVAIGGALTWAATTATGQEEAPTVPSGISVTLQEVRVDRTAGSPPVVRFRYVAPQIAELEFAAVEGDFPALCETQVLPYVAGTAYSEAQAVVSLSAEPVEFGATAPGVIQFFEVFRIEDGACIWEGL